MDDLEKEREELEKALEEVFQDPMVQLGTAVFESREALPDLLKEDLERALGASPELSRNSAEAKPSPEQDQSQELDQDY